MRYVGWNTLRRGIGPAVAGLLMSGCIAIPGLRDPEPDFLGPRPGGAGSGVCIVAVRNGTRYTVQVEVATAIERHDVPPLEPGSGVPLTLSCAGGMARASGTTRGESPERRVSGRAGLVPNATVVP
jgi:hypothetical protein